jgi:hypothetical protein
MLKLGLEHDLPMIEGQMFLLRSHKELARDLSAVEQLVVMVWCTNFRHSQCYDGSSDCPSSYSELVVDFVFLVSSSVEDSLLFFQNPLLGFDPILLGF